VSAPSAEDEERSWGVGPASTAVAPSYRRWALLTAVATFALIVVGGIVRVSDSGLGCGPKGSGVHGWPFCNGDVVPGINLNSIIEYSHRALAGIVVVLIVGLVIGAWRSYRSHRALVLTSSAALLLVISQAVLGGATVEQGLDETLVAAHLGLAMLLLGVVLYAWRATRPQTSDLGPQAGGPGLRPVAIAASAAVFCTIVAGGYMAGTQNYGRADYQLGDGAHHACGKEFPSCNGDFMPFGQSRLVDIHLTHRALMYLATLLLLALVALVLRRRPSPGVVRSAKLIVALLAVQIALGALNVWLDEYEFLIVAHLAAGTLLWAGALGLTLQLYRVPAPAPERARAEALPA
jgi:heme A synthase